jgi:hypothetical protein
MLVAEFRSFKELAIAHPQDPVADFCGLFAVSDQQQGCSRFLG